MADSPGSPLQRYRPVMCMKVAEGLHMQDQAPHARPTAQELHCRSAMRMLCQ